ncbi:hypothetical protein AVEN_63621-1 [Araneus ventricosus]|uniref:Uncharacterized protein n=1 Tax=Araneus ventricosus TaxID=182803 RepID=A0A4Y2W9A4_ARAVE|nr:hypothetical protein AVEN_63621-1 [Araneus ventricosus]
MFIYTYCLSLGYFPTNSRIIFKKVLAEDACSGLVDKVRASSYILVGRGVATEADTFQPQSFNGACDIPLFSIEKAEIEKTRFNEVMTTLASLKVWKVNL